MVLGPVKFSVSVGLLPVFKTSDGKKAYNSSLNFGINIGELFYKGQFIESRFRKNALLLGDSVLGDWGNYTRRIAEVYANQDTLLARVNFLCDIEDITYFVSDNADMSLSKQDSLYLSVKNKYVYLYRCL